MIGKRKNVLKAFAALTAAVVLSVSLVGCGMADGSKLTGGKSGVYGLSGSGIDVDEMVRAAMETRQTDYGRLYKNEKKQEWLKEAYVDLYEEIREFVQVDLYRYKLSSAFSKMNASSTNPAVVTATANADAAETFHDVEVLRLSDGSTNAAVRIDGKYYDAPADRVSVGGVTYSLVGVGGGGNSPVVVEVRLDTDQTIAEVKSFVYHYNAMIDRLNSLFKEECYPEYTALTEEEKSGMTDEEIEAWEAKAKSGLLYRSTTVSKMINAMRETMSIPVTSVYGRFDTAMSIGITAENSAGRLKLDEAPLARALEEESRAVYQLFCSVGENSLSSSRTYNSTGIIPRLIGAAEKILDNIESYAGKTYEAGDGSDLGNLILSLKNKMTSFESSMQKYEETLYKKYDAMEEALEKLMSQASYLGLTTSGEE